jgi:hypothetical protein
MRVLVSRRAVRVLLTLALLVLSSSALAATHPTDAPDRAEQIAARALPSGEQVVQADRQQVAPPGVGNRRGLGGYRLVLLCVLVGIGLLPVAFRRWNPGGTNIRAALIAATPVRAVRAPPRLLSP